MTAFTRFVVLLFYRIYHETSFEIPRNPPGSARVCIWFLATVAI